MRVYWDISRCTNCSLLISSEKMATGSPSTPEACQMAFSANAVFSHGRAGGEHYEVALVQPGREPVEVLEAGLDPRDLPVVLVERLYHFERRGR